MHIQITTSVVINAPTGKVWKVIAHEFGDIGQWASTIAGSKAFATSRAVGGGLNQAEAEPKARVCTTNVPGFKDIQETMTQYNEGAMQYSYEATEGRPWFVTRAENTWRVRSLEISTSEVETRAEVEINKFWGILFAPLMKAQFTRMGNRTLEELKFYIEQGQVHPRKLKKKQRFTEKF